MTDISGLFNNTAAPAAPAPQEGVQQPTQAQAPAQEPYSEAFLKLARKEKEVRQREKGFTQYKTKADQLEQELAGYKSIKENPKANVRKLLDTYGLTYEDINEYILNESDLTLPPQYKEMETKLKSLEERLETERQAAEQKQNQAVIENFKREISTHVDTNGFEFIKANDAIDTVWEVINEYYAETEKNTGKGEILDLARACEFVEKSLEDEFDKRFSSLNKVKSRFQANPEALKPKQPQENHTNYSYGTSNTLSNKLNASQSGVDTTRRLTTEESLAQAAKLLRFV